MYIAFEGIDGAGKSTIAPQVGARLEAGGHQVVSVREPGGTGVGESVRSTLLEAADEMALRTEALLFAAARAQLAAEVITPAIESGAIVISDRTVYSSLAYQGGGRGLGIDEVRKPNEWGLDGVWPDLVILLELDAETGLAREDGPDRISREGLSLMERVAVAYAELAEAEPEIFARVDASQAIHEIVDECVEAIEARL